MRQPAQIKKPRKSQLFSFPGTTSGLISNRNIAVPEQGGAAVLRNWFPTLQGPRLRRGMRRHATLPDPGNVVSLFSYNVAAGDKLFAANEVGIYDVTSPTEAYPQAISPGADEVIGTDDDGIGWHSIEPGSTVYPNTNGDWVVVQFTTGGGTYLVGVNGVDVGFLYDGSTFDDLELTFPSGDAYAGLTTADFSYVWVYKNRLYFIQKNTMNAFYLPVDQVLGTLEVLPLGGVFARGGSLLFGAAWSLSSGGDGGLSEQNVFCTTQGEVAVYQGLSPDDASSWSKEGVYNVGRPLGKKAFIRAGGDLVIATSIGFIPLSRAIDYDTAALGLQAVSNPISDTWREFVDRRGMEGWACELWGEGSMAMIATPTPDNLVPTVLVSNSDSGAWCEFTGWRPYCFEVFRGRLFMGSTDGAIQECWVGGVDEFLPYTGTVIPLFNDIGTQGQRKISKIARVTTRSSYRTDMQIQARYDWNLDTPPAPDAVQVPIGNEWDNALWDQAIWDSERNSVIEQSWRSVGGSGYAASVVVQVTSGAAVPLDVEIVRMDLTYEIADIVS